MLVHRFAIFLFGEDLAIIKIAFPFIKNNIRLEIENTLELFQGQVEHSRDPTRQRLEEPNVCNRTGQVNVTETFTTNLARNDLDTTLFTDDATVLHALVFAAVTLVVFSWPKDFGTEETITLRLECPVVNRFRLLNFAKRTLTYLLGRRDRETNGVKIERVFRPLK